MLLNRVSAEKLKTHKESKWSAFRAAYTSKRNRREYIEGPVLGSWHGWPFACFVKHDHFTVSIYMACRSDMKA